MTTEQKTTTRVQVTVEVIDHQPWASDCVVGTIYMRAKEHALLEVENAIRGDSKIDRRGHIRIVGNGEPLQKQRVVRRRGLSVLRDVSPGVHRLGIAHVGGKRRT